MANFGIYSDWAMVLLSLVMLIGRLEIFPIFSSSPAPPTGNKGTCTRRETIDPGANLNPVRARMQCVPTAENGSGYACRGGLYIRPERPPIPAAVRRRRPPVGREPLTPARI